MTGNHLKTRFGLRCLLTLLIAFGLMAGLTARDASAARGWCLADPVIMVDGQLADVFVTSDLTMLTAASGPIQLVIAIPTGSKGAVVLTDIGYGHGYKISFVQQANLTRTSHHTQIHIRAYVPAKSALDVQVNFAPRALNAGLTAILFGKTAEGVANTWFDLTTS
jgi:hypothetical protein